MKRASTGGGSDINALMRHAAKYAEQAMRNLGRVPPTFLAQTAEGLMVYSPEKMGDERSKNNFANTARLVAVGYQASAVAMILESWVTIAKGGKRLDLSIPPSQSPEREECVVIIVEGRGEKRSKFLEIQRDAQGAFTGFGAQELPNFDELQGRFAGIMPTKPQTRTNRGVARQLLLMMGVAPESLGFNPMWN